jgi:hypothetical protein
MPARARPAWLPRWLFRLSWLASAGLILLVVSAPLLDNGKGRPFGRSRVVALWARDPALRRTAVASAIGLLVTAYVFYRPQAQARPAAPRHPKLPPPPANVVGA